MSSEKRVMIFRELDDKYVLKVLYPIFTHYNCLDRLNEFISNKLFFELKGEYSQIFMFNSINYEKISEILQSLYSVRFHPYSLGIPILVYKGSDVRPTLAFGKYLADICKNKFIIMNHHLIYKLIYGKPIIINANYKYKNAIAVDKFNNFIAYVKITKSKKGKTKVIPVKDIGWYLRRGG
ncbi:MAG: hypothetical protein QXZ61_01145 [Saccharolobus sp.]